MKIPQIVAPAGNIEKLKVAVNYGADAVYLGGQEFSLRKHAKNFQESEIEQGVEYARKRNCNVYAAVNIFAHDDDFKRLPDYLGFLAEVGVEAVIVSDPGVIRLIKKDYPSLKIHLSTQMNTTNLQSLMFWAELGISRVVLARELKLSEIAAMTAQCPIELEMFVHGAVCISYSGRCYLSEYMIGRNANKGDCAHPCRWRYTLVEEKRPGQFYEVEEDERGAYFLNSRDLNLLSKIPRLVELGISAWKIEGRIKGIYYLGAVVKAYREARDAFFDDPLTFEKKLPDWLGELNKVSHRPYYSGPEDFSTIKSTSGSYSRSYQFVGLVKKVLGDDSYLIEARNQIKKGEDLEVLNPHQENQKLRLNEIFDLERKPLELVQPNQEFILKAPPGMEVWAMLRKQLAVAEIEELQKR